MCRLLLLVLVIPFMLAVNGCVGIHDAARKGDLQAIRRYASWGGNLDAKERFNLTWSVDTPLILAVNSGQYDAVKLLIELGADIDEKGEAWYTPVGCAAYPGQERILQLLLDNGAKIEPFKGYHSALSFAAYYGNVKAAEILLDHNADIEHIGIDEATPLMVAVCNDRVEMVEFLLDHGADINTRASYDKSVFGGARSKQMRELLIARGAK